MKHLILFLLTCSLSGCVTFSDRPDTPPVAAIAFQASSGPTVVVRAPIRLAAGQKLSGLRPDGSWTRYVAHPSLGDGSQSESQQPLFILEPGATLEKVRIGKPAADGIHVKAAANLTTTVRQVDFEDVGEDAISVVSGPATGKVLIRDCQFRAAADKVIQVNAPPQVAIEDCTAENFARFARACGTCDDNAPYRITVHDLVARNGVAVLKMSTPKARGEIVGGKYKNVRYLAQASGGAKITVR